jgi:NAD-specific glutamate dehydrogenase
MARTALEGDAQGRTGGEAVAAWCEDTTGPVPRAIQRLNELADGGKLTVARLTVAAALVRDLSDALTTGRAA